mgnify:CR=1 FL=1
MSVGPKTTLTHSRKTAADDTMGGEVFTWADVKNYIGTFGVLSDREKQMYGKKAEGASYKFILDYMFAGGVNTDDRFISGSRVFEIVSKENPMNQNRFVVFLLEENVDG